MKSYCSNLVLNDLTIRKGICLTFGYVDIKIRQTEGYARGQGLARVGRYTTGLWVENMKHVAERPGTWD